MKDKKTKKSTNYLADVLEAVDMMDAKKRLKEDFSSEHSRAIKAVQLANSINGKGYVSISKARNLLSNLYNLEKEKSK
jgi:hypothetical protein